MNSSFINKKYTIANITHLLLVPIDNERADIKLIFDDGTESQAPTAPLALIKANNKKDNIHER